MSLLQKTEEAFHALLAAQVFSTIDSGSIYRGSDAPDAGADTETTKAMPCVIVEALNGERYAKPSPNERVSVRVRVQTSRDDETEDAHAARFNEVFSVLTDTDLPAQLAAAITGLGCDGVVLESTDLAVDRGRVLESACAMTAFTYLAAP